MRNLEVKVKMEDRDSIVNLLKNMGADYSYTMKQVDYYFEVGESKSKLRVIDDQECQLIEYRRVEQQGRKDSSYEVTVLSPEEKDSLLQEREVKKVVEKTRELWMYKHTRIHLDHVEHLGDYLELETVVKDITPEEAENEFATVVEGLQINLAGSVAASYSDLIPDLAP